MLRYKLLHPTILECLGRAGHHSKILIADGNYPSGTTLGPNATHINLNLSPGVVSCTQVLEALVDAVPIDVANTMGIPADDPYAQSDPPIWDEYRAIFKKAKLKLKLEPIQKWDFYEAVRGPDLIMTIQTADQALWANLLLSIGVRKPGQ
ncbi:MAG: transporter [Planctomycetes bacterium]|nr:transporter [Planctomycetota bacterium]